MSQIIATFKNAELGMEALVIGPTPLGYSAVIRDADADQTVGCKIYEAEADAIAYAQKAVK